MKRMTVLHQDKIKLNNNSDSKIRLEHDMGMLLPKIVFCETHRDPYVREILYKITPRLKELGYKIFFAEELEGMSIENHISRIEFSELQVSKEVSEVAQRKSSLPAECLENSVYKNYFDLVGKMKEASICDSNYKFFLQLIQKIGIDYFATDIPLIDGDEDKTFKFAVSPKGMSVRDQWFVNALLNEIRPVFGLYGSGHAIGMQNRILEQIPKDQASCMFYFVNVYKASIIHEDENAMRTGKFEYPLGMALFDANKLDEEFIINNIIEELKNMTMVRQAVEWRKSPKYKRETASFNEIWKNEKYTTDSERIIACLYHYTSEDQFIPPLYRFFNGHWDRHHIVRVNAICTASDEKDAAILLSEIKQIKLDNPQGTCATLIDFLEQEKKIGPSKDDVFNKRFSLCSSSNLI